MKKLVPFILFISCLYPVISIQAQEYKIGLSGGLVVANAHITNKPEILKDTRIFKPMLAFNFNFYASYRSKDAWGFSIEPGYIQKGGFTQSGPFEIRNELNYIHMPLLYDGYLNKGLFLQIGPEFAYLFNAKTRVGHEVTDMTNLYTKKIEISVMAGVNYRIQKKIDIAFRYSHGITSTNQINYANNTTGKQFNQYVQLIIRYKF